MSDIELNENLWGYAKRLRFVCASIETLFPYDSPTNLRVLDVGCGSATQLGLPLARRGYQLTGIDSHAPSIAKANELAQDLPLASFTCGDVEDLRSDPFHVVILSEVLEHVPDPENLLRGSIRHLRSDGLVIVTVPNGYGEFEWDSWIFRTLGIERLVDNYVRRQVENNNSLPVISSTENKENGHIQFFTRRHIYSLFRACGLTVVNQQASTFVSGPFVGHTLPRFSGFIDWNARIADKLPMAFSSGWFFALRPVSEVSE